MFLHVKIAFDIVQLMLVALASVVLCQMLLVFKDQIGHIFKNFWCAWYYPKPQGRLLYVITVKFWWPININCNLEKFSITSKKDTSSHFHWFQINLNLFSKKGKKKNLNFYNSRFFPVMHVAHDKNWSMYCNLTAYKLNKSLIVQLTLFFVFKGEI